MFVLFAQIRFGELQRGIGHGRRKLFPLVGGYCYSARIVEKHEEHRLIRYYGVL